MDTLENMRKALDNIEENLDGEIVYAKIAKIAFFAACHSAVLQAEHSLFKPVIQILARFLIPSC